MTAFIHKNNDAHQTWLADFLSSDIAISGRRRLDIARSDHQPENQMHSDAHSHRDQVRHENESENGNRPTNLN
jgi:hypothetical protein